jgi:hypothetical protein
MEGREGRKKRERKRKKKRVERRDFVEEMCSLPSSET